MSSISSVNSCSDRAVNFCKDHPYKAILATGGSLLALHTIATDVQTTATKAAVGLGIAAIGGLLKRVLEWTDGPLEAFVLSALATKGVSHLANVSLLQSGASLLAGGIGAIAYDQNHEDRKAFLTAVAVSCFVAGATVL